MRSKILVPSDIKKDEDDLLLQVSRMEFQHIFDKMRRHYCSRKKRILAIWAERC